MPSCVWDGSQEVPTRRAGLCVLEAAGLAFLATCYVSFLKCGSTVSRSKNRHDELRADGAEPRTLEEAALSAEKHPNVVFCAAPGGNDDYPAAVRRALGLWKGAPGRFVFTSSGGIYAEQDGGVVDESSLVADGPRAKKLVDCEKLVLEGGGTVLRLAGLYSLERGAHNYWLSQEKVDGRPDGLIGLVSYEDSAGAALAALKCPADIGGEVPRTPCHYRTLPCMALLLRRRRCKRC